MNPPLYRATVPVMAMRRTHEDIQDELLVLQCQEGDSEALKTLIARWQPRFARLAWRLTSEREAARDVVQDAWLAIVRGLKRLDDPARFRPWAYRIVKNKCADWVRRRATRRNAMEQLREQATHPATDGEPNSGDISRLRDAMARLPDEQRMILSLHYSEEMSIIEIAAVLGVPAGTVKSRLFHARNRLKEALERMET